MKERELQKLIKDYIVTMGGVCVKFYAGGLKFGDTFIPQSKNGVSDLLGCWKGRFFAFEVKIKGNKPTLLQKNFIQNVKDSGGIAAVVYSLDDVIEEFSHI